MAVRHRPQITIIGAGPAGITAALCLQKKGIPCLMLDRHKFPREKVCGDGLGGKAISLLSRIDPGLLKELACTSIVTASQAARFYSPNGKMIELSFQPANQTGVSGFISKRKDFDHFLFTQVKKKKEIHVEEGIEIKALQRQDGKINLIDKTDEIIAETRLVLFAGGLNRTLVSQFDGKAYTAAMEGIGVRAYFENVSGSDQFHAIELHFLKELLPWYLWIFPFNDGSANVGLALPEKDAKGIPISLKDLLFQLIDKYPYLKKRFEGARLTGKVEAGRIPYFNAKIPLAGDNYLLLGDAARLVDPFTGEGIGNAMLSGYLAAETAARCLEKNDFSKLATTSYEEAVYAKIGPELKLSLTMHNLARHKFLLNLVIGKASRNEELKQSIAAMLYDDSQKNKLRKPSFYAKLLLGV